MTAVGKILVFVNLLFSLVVGGLVTMVYVARTQWSEEHSKLVSRYNIAQASEEATRLERDRVRKDLDDLHAERNKALEKAVADLDSTVAANKQLNDDLAKVKATDAKSDAAKRALEIEVERRESDVKQMADTLKEERKSNIRLTLEKQTILERAVAAEIGMKSTKDQNLQLLKSLEEKEKEIVRMRNSGGKPTTVAGVTKNPPPEHVDGLIETTDPASGLVTITLGSDAGLVKGHTMEVFRLSAIPTQSKYLGTIRIVEVTATKAVGQPIGRMSAPPQRGDRVASQIVVGGG